MNDDDEALKQWDATVRSTAVTDRNLSIPPTVSRTRKHDGNIVTDSKLALASDLHTNRADLQDVDDNNDDDDNNFQSIPNQGTNQSSRAATSPDYSFAATNTVKLARGYTAYKLIKPDVQHDDSGNIVEPMTIVCLHGLLESSYIWEDIVEILSNDESGPRARILVFDFYGHGRSPWSGFPCTLDVYVTQMKELMDALGLSSGPVHVLGYCMGGAVATGFAVKFPHLCKSLCMVSSAGVRMKNPARYKILKRKCLGELVMMHRRRNMPEAQLEMFFDSSFNCEHRPLIRKQMDMVQWQLNNTPGYMGAVLSTYRYFPLSGMGDLFSVAGRRDRPVLILWGSNDNMFPLRKALPTLEHSFPSAEIISIQQCGHNPLFEKFEDVATAVVDFYKHMD